jgi:hypothetical protein
MEHFLKYKLLGIPLLVWGLQLLYVAGMLGLLVVIVLATKLNQRPLHTKLLVVVPYIIAMIAIDILWRTAIKKHLPGWF